MKGVYICVASLNDAAFNYAALSLSDEDSVRFLPLDDVTADDIDAFTRKDKSVVLWADKAKFSVTMRGQVQLKANETMADEALLVQLRFTSAEVVTECPINPGCFNIIRSRLRPLGGSLGPKKAANA